MNLKPQCLCPQEPGSVMILIIQSFNTSKGTERAFFLRGVTAIRGCEMASILYECCWEDVKDLCFGKRTISASIQRVNHFHDMENMSVLSKHIGEGDGTPLQYSCLENPMGGVAWWATVHGVAKSQTRLRDFTFTFHFHALEKEMATHSSVLAWRIPGVGEPGGLPSMGLHRVRHDWSDLAAAAAASKHNLDRNLGLQVGLRYGKD